MTNKLSISGKTTIRVPAEKALAIVRDIHFIEWYEPKVDSAHIRMATERTGFYSARGYFAWLPWGGKFSYELREDGFQSELLRGPLGVKVEGGVVVRTTSPDECSIIHYERYQFPRWMTPFLWLIRLYLLRAMKEEMKNLVEVINRAFQPKSKSEEPISVLAA